MGDRHPPSIEDLRNQRLLKDHSQSGGKPVFLTKAQRQQMALERRQKEVEERRQQLDRERHLSRINHTDPQYGQKRPLDRPETSDSGVGPSSSDVVKKKPRSRYVFEWDDTEDTSLLADSDGILKDIGTRSAYLFGRGKQGGMSDLDAGLGRSRGRATGHSSNSESSSKRRYYMDLDWREKPLEYMTTRDWRIMRDELQIQVKSTTGSSTASSGAVGRIPLPIRSWDEADLHYRIRDVINQIGFEEPTAIQRQAIPIGKLNRDLIGIAETGSGKTVAFLIPMLEFILKLPPMTPDTAMEGPYALVLTPTRELAQQIHREAVRFCEPLEFHCVSIVGDRSISEQTYSLRNGAQIIVGTPGRIRDLLDQRILVLNQCTYVVMDEADRMVVDMGFEADLDYILGSLPVSTAKPDSEAAMDSAAMFTESGLPKYRQTTMFSATMPSSVERIAMAYMKKPAVITVGEVGRAVSTISQIVQMIGEDQKEDRLLRLLRQRQYEPPIIVFVRSKKGVDYLSQLLEDNRFYVAVMHGGRSQESREAALRQLKHGKKDILVATDVAGRGIDIPNVSLVVNYDMPKTIEGMNDYSIMGSELIDIEYTHRIGRTGRAGKSGTAVSFVTRDDTHIFYDLKEMLRTTNNTVPRELSAHEGITIRSPFIALMIRIASRFQNGQRQERPIT